MHLSAADVSSRDVHSRLPFLVPTTQQSLPCPPQTPNTCGGWKWSFYEMFGVSLPGRLVRTGWRRTLAVAARCLGARSRARRASCSRVAISGPEMILC